jgi:hypothetical protein
MTWYGTVWHGMGMVEGWIDFKDVGKGLKSLEGKLSVSGAGSLGVWDFGTLGLWDSGTLVSLAV